MKISYLIILIQILVLQISAAKSYHEPDTNWVSSIAVNGLIIREQANLNSQIIGALQFGDSAFIVTERGEHHVLVMVKKLGSMWK